MHPTDFYHRPPVSGVLGIGGSPRKRGNSDLLLNRILESISQCNIPAAEVHLRDFQFQGCVGCERCRKDRVCTGLNDGMSLLYPKIYASRGIVLVSPTHNYNITAWMKAFIDRLYCFYIFDDQRPRAWSSRLADQGRKAVLAAVCEQHDVSDMGFTLEAMRRPIQALGYDIVGELPVFGIFDKGRVKTQTPIMNVAAELGVELAASINGPATA